MASVADIEKRLRRLKRQLIPKTFPRFERWCISEGAATNLETKEEITVDELRERNPHRIEWISVPALPQHDPDWAVLAYYVGKMREGEDTIDGVARAMGYGTTEEMEEDWLNGRTPITERYERCLESARRRVMEAGRSWGELVNGLPEWARRAYRPPSAERSQHG
jgi:hypothetical protein